ncbi:hypothetical protein ACGGAQ_22660 [Micromonospora sp. NPDC047557]|uniref:hypothetical protein n=1 Tax=Micromonospora sp. NPDC047557 TaxID=3364250 RepID=UPI00371904BF
MILSFGYLILRQLLQRLIVEFDEGETLDVWDPEDLTVNERALRDKIPYQPRPLPALASAA